MKSKASGVWFLGSLYVQTEDTKTDCSVWQDLRATVTLLSSFILQAGTHGYSVSLRWACSIKASLDIHSKIAGWIHFDFNRLLNQNLRSQKAAGGDGRLLSLDDRLSWISFLTTTASLQTVVFHLCMHFKFWRDHYIGEQAFRSTQTDDDDGGNYSQIFKLPWYAVTFALIPKIALKISDHWRWFNARHTFG